MIETLVDPGNGSGIFNQVESDKTITFHSDGSLTSNGSLCDVSIGTESPTSGTYSLENSTYTSDDCSFPAGREYGFELQGEFLIIYYPCFEPCREKYKKG